MSQNPTGWTKEKELVDLQYVEKGDKTPIVILFNGYETKPRQLSVLSVLKCHTNMGVLKFIQ